MSELPESVPCLPSYTTSRGAWSPMFFSWSWWLISCDWSLIDFGLILPDMPWMLPTPLACLIWGAFIWCWLMALWEVTWHVRSVSHRYGYTRCLKVLVFCSPRGWCSWVPLDPIGRSSKVMGYQVFVLCLTIVIGRLKAQTVHNHLSSEPATWEKSKVASIS